MVYDISEFTESDGTYIFLGENCAKFAAQKYGIEFKKTNGEETYRILSVKLDCQKKALAQQKEQANQDQVEVHNPYENIDLRQENFN